MKNLVAFMHVSLDGYAAGPDGALNWITVNEEIFDHVKAGINGADTALYGRVTWQMMEAYWPTAADKPGATRHDIHHSQWYNNVAKVVLSRTMAGKIHARTKFVSDNLVAEINAVKNAPGSQIVIFGSPTATHALMAQNLIDEYWLFVNPVLLGDGVPMFKDLRERRSLTLVASHVFSSGVVCLHYRKK